MSQACLMSAMGTGCTSTSREIRRACRRSSSTAGRARAARPAAAASSTPPSTASSSSTSAAPASRRRTPRTTWRVRLSRTPRRSSSRTSRSCAHTSASPSGEWCSAARGARPSRWRMLRHTQRGARRCCCAASFSSGPTKSTTSSAAVARSDRTRRRGRSTVASCARLPTTGRASRPTCSARTGSVSLAKTPICATRPRPRSSATSSPFRRRTSTRQCWKRSSARPRSSSPSR
mmetsp:Transcript_56556/g.129899  ORF Transcript_56556/g.129899 Transcript_56556/m.129899 type:complete len:233 (+) Transcript_56556:266-964(+)